MFVWGAIRTWEGSQPVTYGRQVQCSTTELSHHNCYSIADVWSAGTVLAELLLGQPIFPGDSGVDQLVEIIKVLGTPSREQIQQMNPNYTEFKFPQIKAHPWQKVTPLLYILPMKIVVSIFGICIQVFRPRTPAEAIDLVSRLLEYTPTNRLSPLQVGFFY